MRYRTFVLLDTPSRFVHTIPFALQTRSGRTLALWRVQRAVCAQC